MTHTVASFEQRIIGILNAAHDAYAYQTAMTESLAWYREAHNFADSVARLAEISTVQAAGLVAAFSIRTRWEANLRDVVLFLGQHEVRGLSIRTDKAAAILALGTDATPDQVAGILNGPKVRSFFDNVLNPETSNAVTIDTWMAKALQIEQSDLTKVVVRADRKAGTAAVRLYDVTAQAFRNVAATLEMSALQLQALVWVLVRGAAY